MGVNKSGFRIGGEYFQAKNYKTVNSLAASVFGTSSVVGATATAVPVTDKAEGFSSWVSYAFPNTWNVFGRYDNAKLSKDVAPNLKDTYFYAGVGFKPTKQIDFAVVYKNEKIENGSSTISGADAGGSYTIGGANGTRSGKFDEIGLYTQWQF